MQYTYGVLHFLVEATGLEPTTFWSLTKRATKLRYASIYAVFLQQHNYYTYPDLFSQAFFTLFLTFFKKVYNKSFITFINHVTLGNRKKNATSPTANAIPKTEIAPSIFSNSLVFLCINATTQSPTIAPNVPYNA